MVKLKVNNEFVDTVGKDQISITIQANDIGDISTRNGSYSTSIKLPKTNHNISLFGYIDNLGVVSLSNPSKRYDAELYNKGAFFKSGFIKVNSVDTDNINVTFYGDNVGWFEIIKDRKLRQLDLSEFNHNWTESNVIASWADSWTWEDGYTYPIIDYTTTTLDGISGKNLPLDLENMRIAVYAKQLIKRIIDSTGYSLTGSLWEKDVSLNNLILPFTGQGYTSPEPTYEDRSAEYTSSFVMNGLEPEANPSTFSKVIDYIPERTTNNTYWNAVDNQLEINDFIFMSFDMSVGLIAPIGNYYYGSFAFNQVVDAGGGQIVIHHEQIYNVGGGIVNPNPGDLIILKGGLYDGGVYTVDSANTVSNTITVTTSFLGDSSGTIAINQSGNLMRFLRPYFTINGGTKVYDDTPQSLIPNDIVEFGVDNLDGGFAATEFSSYEAFKVDMMPDYESSLNGGVNINIALPDMTQGDFLNNILFMFGSVVSTNDQTKEISIDYFDDIINDIPNAINWSDKIDKSKSSEIDYSSYLSKYGRKNNVLYKKDDNDTAVVNYNRSNPRELGSGEIDIDNDFLTDIKTLFTSAFAVTPDKRSGSFILPLIDVRFNALNAKLLLNSNDYNIIDISNGELDTVSVGLTTGITDVSASWHIPNPSLERLTLPSLNFGDNKGLLNIYFNTLISAVNSGALVKENILLNDNDIREFNPLAPIRLDQYQSYFYVNKINQYKGDGGSTVVELIKIA